MMKDRIVSFAELQMFINKNLPLGKRTVLNCGGKLFLDLLPSGNARFFVRQRIEGKDTKTVIGLYPDNSLKEAREKANKIIKETQDRHDYSLSVAPTFGEYAKTWLEFFLPNPELENSHKNNKRYQTVKSYINALKGLHDVPIDMITPYIVDKVLSKTDKTQGTKYRAIRALNQCLNSAVIDEVIKENPCRNLTNSKGLLSKKYAKPKCKGYPWVPAEQLKEEYFERLAHINLSRRYFYLFHALTFVRNGAITQIEWDWIDLQNKCIKIPGVAMKNGRDFNVPVTRFTEILLKNWKDECIKQDEKLSKYVFHSRSSLSTPIAMGYLQEPVRNITGVDVTMHGLRKSARTWMASIGVPELISEIALSHVSKNQLVNVYNKHDYFRERMAVLTLWDYFIYTQLPDEFRCLITPIDQGYLDKCNRELEAQKNKIDFLSSEI